MKPKSVHLVAACGTAMGSLAGILKSQGVRVTGSDQNVYPPMSTELARLGVELFSGYSPEHLSHKPELVVIGNAVRKDNVEARAAIDGGMRYVSFTDALAEYFLDGKESIVIGGTHGKTTTTSLFAQVLIASGRDPNVFVGGIAANLGGSFRLGQGRYAVLEGDEYDTAFFDKTPKFWHYRVKYGLVTHLEYDHADIYPNIEAVEAAFKNFIALVPEDGALTACVSAPRLAALLGHARTFVQTYSAQGVPADWTVQDLSAEPERSSFTARNEGRDFGRFAVPLVGLHNVENALGVVAAAARLGLSAAEIQHGFETFTGVRRRMELRGEARGVAVIDDFAHHPTAVKATIAAAKQKFPGRRIIAIFEPRSQTSRRKIFQREYEKAFADAEVTFIAEPFGTEGLSADERFDPRELCQTLCDAGRDASVPGGVDEIVRAVSERARPGDVVLVMSNGGFGGIHDKLLSALR